MSQSRVTISYEAQTGADADLAAEKDAETEEIAQVEVPQPQLPHPGPQMRKTMHIVYRDAGARHTFQWDARVHAETFLHELKKHFRIPSAIRIKWKDDTGAFVVFDESLPSGTYSVFSSSREVQFDDLVHESKTRKIPPKKFGRALLAMKEADCFMTCERAWLGLVRALIQLDNMILFFLLRLFWGNPTIEFQRAVILVAVALVISHLSFFAVGYYRYTSMIKLIQDISRYRISEPPDRGGPEVWLERFNFFFGLVLAASGVVALMPFYDSHVSALPFFS